MRKGLEVNALRIGERVKTDTGRHARVVAVSAPFHQVLLQFDNATPDAWWPVSNLERETGEPFTADHETRWCGVLARMLYATDYTALSAFQKDTCDQIARISRRLGNQQHARRCAHA
jgi:hypothetical protein